LTTINRTINKRVAIETLTENPLQRQKASPVVINSYLNLLKATIALSKNEFELKAVQAHPRPNRIHPRAALDRKVVSGRSENTKDRKNQSEAPRQTVMCLQERKRSEKLRNQKRKRKQKSKENTLIF